MQISEEIFQNILEQPDPVDLSRLTPYCSDLHWMHFLNTVNISKIREQRMNMPICLLIFSTY